jgi:hypothetical protein
LTGASVPNVPGSPFERGTTGNYTFLVRLVVAGFFSNQRAENTSMNRFLRLVTAVVLIAPLLTGCTKQPSPVTSENPVEIVIPFKLTDQNNIVVTALLNDTDSLNLMLHTAASDVTLTEEGVRKSKSIKLSETKRVKSWGGEANAQSATDLEAHFGAGPT